LELFGVEPVGVNSRVGDAGLRVASATLEVLTPR
jgi:hypothetical protein